MTSRLKWFNGESAKPQMVLEIALLHRVAGPEQDHLAEGIWEGWRVSLNFILLVTGL